MEAKGPVNCTDLELSIYLQELAAGYFPICSCDTESFVPSKSMSIASKSYQHGKKTVAFPGFQFSLTCSNSMDDLGADSLTASAADSPAQKSAQQAKVVGSTENTPGCGENRRESFAKFDPDSHSWRTRQLSLDGGLMLFSGTWPQWGSMLDGECSAEQKPDFPTYENAYGLLPTPSGVNGGRNNTMGRVDEWGGSSNPLRGTVIGSMCLPEFEELLMGWPVTWTAPMPYATDKFHAWLQQHGEFFRGNEQ